MSHDHITQAKPPKLRIINKSRLIAGLLAEMDAAAAIVVVRDNHSEDSKTFTLSCDFRIPFETSLIRISGEELPPGSYRASALFAGQRITFELIVIDTDGTCKFPHSLSLLDLRRSKRRTFGPEVQTAEISGENAVTFATPIDISHNSMALVSATSDPPLKIGDTVHIKIRGGIASRDVFGFRMRVQDVDRSRSATRILLGLIETIGRSTYSDERRVERRPIDSTSISISPIDSHIGEQVVGRITDVSITGLSVELNDTPKGNWFTPGLHVKLQNGLVHATIMWRDGKKSGLRLDALDESRTLSAWFDVLRQLSPEQSVHHSQVDDLVNLFTESGLLKGTRRKIFGVKPGRYLPPETVTNNPLLYHRIASTIEDGKIAGQVSMVRLTDEYWCMQEGTHNGDGRAISYDDLLLKVLVTARDLSASSVLAPRYVGGLVHRSVKSSANFMDSYTEKSINRKYDTFHLSIRSLDVIDGFRELDTPISSISKLPADERRNIANTFDPTIFDVFCSANGSHSRLNAELSQLGPLHQAETVRLTHAGDNWGLAYRLKSYYSLSSTGVINSSISCDQNESPA